MTEIVSGSTWWKCGFSSMVTANTVIVRGVYTAQGFSCDEARKVASLGWLFSYQLLKECMTANRDEDRTLQTIESGSQSLGSTIQPVTRGLNYCVAESEVFRVLCSVGPPPANLTWYLCERSSERESSLLAVTPVSPKFWDQANAGTRLLHDGWYVLSFERWSDRWLASTL